MIFFLAMCFVYTVNNMQQQYALIKVQLTHIACILRVIENMKDNFDK